MRKKTGEKLFTLTPDFLPHCFEKIISSLYPAKVRFHTVVGSEISSGDTCWCEEMLREGQLTWPSWKATAGTLTLCIRKDTPATDRPGLTPGYTASEWRRMAPPAPLSHE